MEMAESRELVAKIMMENGGERRERDFFPSLKWCTKWKMKYVPPLDQRPPCRPALCGPGMKFHVHSVLKGLSRQNIPLTFGVEKGRGEVVEGVEWKITEMLDIQSTLGV